MSENQISSSLIIGYGLLGAGVLQALRRKKQQVWATTRSDHKFEDIKESGASPLQLDMNIESTWENLLLLGEHWVNIFVLVPPSQIELDSLKKFLSFIRRRGKSRIILSSSTVVYGTAQRIVTADSEVEINSKRAERQYAIEQFFKDSIDECKIVRLAGLYSKDRVIGRKAILENRLMEGKGEAWLNLIHINDAARLLLMAMETGTAGKIELGSDGSPVRRGKYYTDLANFLSAKTPVFQNQESKKGEGRQCDSTVTMTRTGWQPRINDYKKGWLV
jgi:nucleoside-diphosphate-sugar epimerase